MPKLLIFDAFTLLIREKNVAIYALLRCKIFSLKMWVCKILDKFHVCKQHLKVSQHISSAFSFYDKPFEFIKAWPSKSLTQVSYHQLPSHIILYWGKLSIFLTRREKWNLILSFLALTYKYLLKKETRR